MFTRTYSDSLSVTISARTSGSSASLSLRWFTEYLVELTRVTVRPPTVAFESPWRRIHAFRVSSAARLAFSGSLMDS